MFTILSNGRVIINVYCVDSCDVETHIKQNDSIKCLWVTLCLIFVLCEDQWWTDSVRNIQPKRMKENVRCVWTDNLSFFTLLILHNNDLNFGLTWKMLLITCSLFELGLNCRRGRCTAPANTSSTGCVCNSQQKG